MGACLLSHVPLGTTAQVLGLEELAANPLRAKATVTLFNLACEVPDNRAQQDGFLPFVENGTVTLVGATTENPSFELNSALLSRCKVFVMKPLNEPALDKIMKRAEELSGMPLPLSDEARKILPGLADGDGRYLINLMESVYLSQDCFGYSGSFVFPYEL